MNSWTLKEIAIKDIDEKDCRFSFRYKQDFQAVDNGLMPVVFYKDKDFIIVDGRKRFNFFKKENNKIPALVIENMPEKDVFVKAIEFNKKTMQEIDEVNAVGILTKRYGVDEKEIKKIFSNIILEKYLAIDDAGDFLKDAICNGSIKLMQAAYVMDFFNKDEIESVLSIIVDCKLNMNEQKEFVEDIIFISRKEKKESLEIIKELNMPLDKDAKEKKNMLRLFLKNRRYPEIMETMAKVEQDIKNIKLPKDIQVNMPKLLEGDVVSFCIQAKDVEDLKNKIEILKNKAEGFKNLFEYL